MHGVRSGLDSRHLHCDYRRWVKLFFSIDLHARIAIIVLVSNRALTVHLGEPEEPAMAALLSYVCDLSGCRSNAVAGVRAF